MQLKMFLYYTLIISVIKFTFTSKGLFLKTSYIQSFKGKAQTQGLLKDW